MTCALCKQENELRNSHIIPEFIYKPLYDDNHRFHVLSTLARQPRPLEQKGLRERLLCDECEEFFSKLEKYASQVLYGGVELDIKREGNLISVTGVDYKKYKLFLLSILWRASVSRLDFFDQIKLGPHENTIRNMLLENDPGNFEKYGVLPFLIMHEDEVQHDLIFQPSWGRLNGHYIYRFVFGGCLWVYLVSSHNKTDELKNVFVSETGKATFIVSDYEKHTRIIDFAKQLKQLGRI